VVISEKQAARMWALGHGANKSRDAVIATIQKYGFQTARDVTTDRYDAVCAEIAAA
jgi:hypothetical protein